jgi:hypothetical protein
LELLELDLEQLELDLELLLVETLGELIDDEQDDDEVDT